MPRPVIISQAAERDIESILVWSHERFGEQARLRYEAILCQAIVDVAEDPDRVGCHLRPEIAANARTYHHWHSRSRVLATKLRVSKPRHLLLIRVCDDGRIEIGRVLHDSMDLDRYLPEA
jgi:toxin ParE1/3/4